ncbi:MAG TPA: TerC family protein [Planctomycetota bacterium]|nr:TerC family protein [Planctomycetota bacterium]
MSDLFTSANLIAFLTLAALEIVLGIDNVVFISILSNKLPEAQRARARRIGLMLALVGRIALLLSLGWVMRLTTPLFALLAHDVTGRDLILLLGGLFLIAKATFEIHERLEGHGGPGAKSGTATFGEVLLQILLLDLVFSLDSVITAVGMSSVVPVMVAAVVVAILVMLAFAGPISRFVERHPTVKMLALAFLMMIGLMLLIEGFGKHVPKGYIYFAMAFSLSVELLNLKISARNKPVELRGPKLPEA